MKDRGLGKRIATIGVLGLVAYVARLLIKNYSVSNVSDPLTGLFFLISLGIFSLIFMIIIWLGYKQRKS